MDRKDFKAYAVTNEIDLNKIAIECGIPKKYTWEEPLGLQGEILANILKRNVSKDQKIFVFSFGSIVFINTLPGDTTVFLEYLKKIKPELDMKNYNVYNDDYELQVSNTYEIKLTDKFVTVPNDEVFYAELVAIVIAKSVALEKTEYQLGKILDKLESKIDRLERGRMRLGDKEIAKTISDIVRHEYNSIAYIMILDKPDITWTNGEAGAFYERMSEFFELSDRYEIIKQKTNILNNIIDGFSTISHSMRGIFIEWIVILLIFIEIVLMVIGLFK